MILITRPTESAVKTQEELSKYNIPYLLEPLINFQPIAKLFFNYQENQILLVTSINAIRSLEIITKKRDYKIIAIGLSTAQYALKQGFNNTIAAGDTVQELFQFLIKHYSHEKLLYISGNHISYPLTDMLKNSGIEAQRVIIYNTNYSKTFTAKCYQAFISNKITGVALFSLNTAKVFIKLIIELQLTHSLKLINAYSFSKNISLILMQLSWRTIYTSHKPTHDSLIKTIVNSQQ